METITKQFEVYKFGELSDEVKQSIIDNHYKDDDFPFLCDDIVEHLTSLDGKGVFSNFDLSYSLGNCQGDGLSFSADFDFEKFLSNYDFQGFKKRALFNYFKVSVTKNRGHYCYAHKDCVDFTENYYRSGSTELEHLCDLFNSVLDDIQTYYIEVCKEAEKYGYSLIEYRMSFEEYEEFSDSDNLVYLANGDEFNS